MLSFAKWQCVPFIALASWLPVASQSQASVLQALGEKAGCRDASDSEAARCLFKSWYPLSHHWRLTPEYDPKSHAGAELYGELEPEGVDQILTRVSEVGAPLSEDDVFADMGSGVGQVALLVFFKSSVHKILGIELMEERHKLAVRAHQKALDALSALEGDLADQVQVDSRELRLLKGDITDKALYDQWADTSVVFTCSIAFPEVVIDGLREALIANLRPGTIIFTLKPLGGDYRDLAPLDAFPVRTSWSDDTKAFLYIKNLKPLVLNELNVAISESESVLDDCASWAEGSDKFATKNVVQRFCYAFAWKWGERAQTGIKRLDYIWVVPEL